MLFLVADKLLREPLSFTSPPEEPKFSSRNHSLVTTTMPFFSKIQRQSDFNLFDSKTPLVIDNGASYFRIGWAGESEPRVVFRHIVQRPHHKGTGETVTIVGDHDPALLKYFDFTRSRPRSAFDGNVVCQFETMEYILDFGFDRMGANGTKIDHPVLITECVCNPVRSRSRMAELLFETYGVPSIAFGVDVAFGYKYNQQQGVCAKDGLALCPGFNTTHVIPFVDGEPVYEACCRTNIGGFHVTDQLKQLLSLKYPYHLGRFTWEKVEDLKVEHCYIAPDYRSEAQLFQKGAKEAEEKTRYWQIPWVPPPVEEPPSEEKDETEKVDPAANEKYSLINIPDDTLTQEQLNEKKKQLSLKSMAEGRQRLKQKRHEKELERERKQQLKKKELERERKQQLKKEKRLDEDRQLYKLLMKDYNGDEDEDTFRARNEQLYKFLIKDYKGDREEPDDEQSRISSTPQDRDPTFISKLEVGTSRPPKVPRVPSLTKKEDFQIPTFISKSEAGTSRPPKVPRVPPLTKKEDFQIPTFISKSEVGTSRPPKVPRVPPLTKKEDFQIPTFISKSEAGNSRPPKVPRVPPLTKKEDYQIPTFISKSEAGTSRPPKMPRVPPLTKKEDFQIVLGVERFRCPELLFTPNLIAVDQVGLDEMVGVSIKRLPDKDESLEERLTSSILVTGGSSLFPGIVERLEAGIRMIRPSGAPIKIVRALDPVMDAWRGAASFASGPQFHEKTFSKSDYYEKGKDWLRNYQLQYTL